MSRLATAARDVLLITRYDALTSGQQNQPSDPGALLEAHFESYPEHRSVFPASLWLGFAKLALEIDVQELIDVLSPEEASPRPCDLSELPLFAG